MHGSEQNKLARMARRQRTRLSGGLMLLGCFRLIGLPAAEINPPAGEWIGPGPDAFAQSSRFSAEDRLVLTPYFYWYDVWSGAHITNADGSDALTTHPPSLTGFSYKSKQWHRTQLQDMRAAGIDIVLPVYWGSPADLAERGLDHWSYAGLPPLVEAREALLAEGEQPPAIGLFYDTSTLQFNPHNRHVDLTTEMGRQWFYESIRDFFSLIPPRHWALLEEKAVVVLYVSHFAKAYDIRVFNYAREQFRRDFGRDLYLVKEISWNLPADNSYAWGGALGLKAFGVASLGPGYDHSAVPGRDPLVVEREQGDFFRRNWERALRIGAPMVFVETWNEFHEGTDIAHSREYGRQYIELNRHYVDWFKQGHVPPWPEGPYTGRDQIGIVLGAPNQGDGLEQVEWADGVTEPAVINALPCRVTQPTEHAGHYMYFRIDDSFKQTGLMDARLSVTFMDAAAVGFTVQFDGSDPGAPLGGAYTQSASIVRGQGSGNWRTVHFQLDEARFLNSQNGGADFRLAVLAGTLAVHEVLLSREEQPEGDPTARIRLRLQRQSGNELVLALGGPIGTRCFVQTSNDLSDWISISSHTLSEAESLLTGLRIHEENRRFFRAMVASSDDDPPEVR